LLEHTFIHISGIGPKTEQHLWQRGILTWTEFLRHEQMVFSSPARDAYVRRQLEASVDNRNNIGFFLDRLSSPNLWRVFGRFRDRAVYLDIETNGGYRGTDEITLIGLYDGQSVQTFINGINLSDFEFAVATYDLVITFNGSQFDLPVIRRHFPHIALPAAHIDLRFLLRSIGYRGGLKLIERSFGLTRGPQIDGLDGYDAVRLWRAYDRGDQRALDRLIQYNTADIVNLKPLMERASEEMKRRLLSFDEACATTTVFC
jgi:uncharacterized protein YprB with RNaseH-like and TPR domain